MMGKKLLIVESPAKAKTIGKYLGDGFLVKSSVGHIRDLPQENGAVKIVEDGPGKWKFEPRYAVPKEKAKVVATLRIAASDASEIYLASDPDREGEAIAWHLKEVLAPAAPGRKFRRVTYNEITKDAVLKAVSNPGEIDMKRVDAQQARRILDRLVGYRVSPLLWKYVPCANARSLSAGRVQSVALRLLVERQREIDAFKPETYYLLGVEAGKPGFEAFRAKLSRIDGEKPDIRGKHESDGILLDLSGASVEVSGIVEQAKARRPPPPFTTSSMQQAASSVLGFSPGKTMKLAQSLYEHGTITYMRTDSVAISDQARAAAKEFITSHYGAEYYPDRPNIYKSKASAQGAHEAIRPTNVSRTPDFAGLDPAETKLYGLIWRRFMASQMRDAKTTLRTVSLVPVKRGIAHSYIFTASAMTIDFDGFLKAMAVLKTARKRTEQESEERDEDTDEVETLPPLAKGDQLEAVRWISDEKQTKGPSHYSEASLIKALEENGVGRPSTYASTIETLKTREYARSEKRKLVPLDRGTMVCDWLVKKLDSLFNVGYTAQMEAQLDRVEDGGERMNGMLSAFYADFQKALEACAEPAPDAAKLDAVFAMLDEVKEWKPAKKAAGRTYDDKAFVESVKRQRASNRPLSARQLEYLVRMVSMYSAQIKDATVRLASAGLGQNAAAQEISIDPALVEFCFATIERIGGMSDNSFIKSLRDQHDRGRRLTPRQFTVLARAAGENAVGLPDCSEIRARLAGYVPGGFDDSEADPAIPVLLSMMDGITEWRPAVRRGKKLYDDRDFMESLRGQYARRKNLSLRQTYALKRVVTAYRDQIPGYAERAKELGLPLDGETPPERAAKEETQADAGDAEG